MKKIIIAISLFFATGLISLAPAQNINININLDKQPSWGPTGYDYAGYYYIPDLNVYYDIANSLFYYLSGSNWISNQYLPDRYRKYDLYSMYKVVINEQQPWSQNKTHKKSYSQYKGDRTQEPIRYSNNSKYDTSKNNNRSWVSNDRRSTNINSKTSNKKEGNINNNRNNNNSKSTNNRQTSNSSGRNQNDRARN
ncbi:hypothetical protein M2451_002230 [Dysgonomonas sp. PFB1-18]|uniref:hypothetical protein n=1 Tax=unclassified Dysgonomonas TaxID=2630389 RepID=UPI0024730826|nr:MULTISPECIES: hypothetical protein [unclassified Dysgonomonas]MDH6309859.1 hypothetical protein [Dysgonomonas sp. PF1-14]MDH6339403.1 hypothetical protein [Dysgonomonas sp. PF1-16]MDH6380902.1 hypothetical protein [Dysgonomonas sp. PFB1-18]MDH6397911.1 hypothetical protein [Dysgonomonas sp. PF1-23]